MKADLIVKDEGKFWGLNVQTASIGAELFSKNYFKGLTKRKFYIPQMHANYFIALALSCGLTVETIKD